MFSKFAIILFLSLTITIISITQGGKLVIKSKIVEREERSNNLRNFLSVLAGKNDKVVSMPKEGALKKTKVSLLKTLAPVLASSFCAAAIMYPFDLIRALQMANAGSSVKLSTGQLLSNFRKTHGIKGFFTQGLAPELARSTWMRFVKFSLFPICHLQITRGLLPNEGTPLTKALAGIVSSIPEAISIMPLEIAKVALQLDSAKRFNNNMFKAMAHVFEERGLNGFTVGYFGVQTRQSLWTAAYFASVGVISDQIDKIIKCTAGKDFDVKKHKGLNAFSQLLSGFLAGVFGTILNTPSDTIRTTLQKRLLASGEISGATSFIGVANEIIKNKGAGALYAGFKVKSLHLGGGGALMAFFVPFFTKIFEKF